MDQKVLVKKNLSSKQFGSEKNFGPKNNFGLKKERKYWLKQIGSENKKFWGKKLGQKKFKQKFC